MKNKVVVIIGASSGIGDALTVECVVRGFVLALAGINPEQDGDWLMPFKAGNGERDSTIFLLLIEASKGAGHASSGNSAFTALLFLIASKIFENRTHFVGSDIPAHHKWQDVSNV